MIGVQTTAEKGVGQVFRGSRSYHEIVEYLDALAVREYSEFALQRAKKLNKACGDVASKIDTILVGGSNGKSLSMNFAAKLFREEGFRAALIFSDKFLNYTEQFVVNGEYISTTQFTEVLNEVITVATEEKLNVTRSEILTVAGMMHAVHEGAEVALVEVGLGGRYDAASLCTPKITVVTRVADDATAELGSELDDIAKELVTVSQPGAWFVSAEQSKLRLQKMKTWVEDLGGNWAMPIRKLAPLPYIYEQLYGRIASLGERIVQIYAEEIKEKFSPFLRGNLLATQKGKRGRPTLEAKRQAELNPIKTMRTFWSDEFSLLRGRFEFMDKEKPPVLLDNASNLDALTNTFLGIRLLHYQRPLKGFVLILGVAAPLNVSELLKGVRYLLKKVPGEVFFVPLPGRDSVEMAKLLELAKDLNIRARHFGSIAEALPNAKDAVDEREGLVAVAGSSSMITAYWQARGAKKLIV